MDKEAQRIKAMRRVRQLNKHLRDLTETVTAFLAALLMRHAGSGSNS